MFLFHLLCSRKDKGVPHEGLRLYPRNLIYSDRTMKVQVNNKEVELIPNSTLTQLTTQLELPVQGIAIAVNNKMIPRTEWERFVLHENDNLVIIKAACGG